MATFTGAFFVLVSSPFVHGMVLPESFFSHSGHAGFGEAPTETGEALQVASTDSISEFWNDDSRESVSTSVARTCDPLGFAKQIAEQIDQHGILDYQNTGGSLSQHEPAPQHAPQHFAPQQYVDCLASLLWEFNHCL